MFMFGMVAIKALGYSLNSPAKEMLYLQTSRDIKLKAKSWIDMFGSRAAKAMGAAVTNALRDDPSRLLSLGSLFSAALATLWIGVAGSTGRLHRHLTERDIVVT